MLPASPYGLALFYCALWQGRLTMLFAFCEVAQRWIYWGEVVGCCEVVVGDYEDVVQYVTTIDGRAGSVAAVAVVPTQETCDIVIDDAWVPFDQTDRDGFVHEVHSMYMPRFNSARPLAIVCPD